MLFDALKDEKKKYDASYLVVIFITVGIIFPLAILGCFVTSSQAFITNIIGMMSGVVTAILGASQVKNILSDRKKNHPKDDQ